MSLLRRLSLSVALLSLLTVSPAAYGQNPPNDQTGTPPYQSFGGQHENISLATGNLNLQIPLLTLPGRNGHNLVIGLEYDSALWQLNSNPQVTGGLSNPPMYNWVAEDRYPTIDGYWRLNLPVLTMSVQQVATNIYCWTNFLVTLSDGSKHSFNIVSGTSVMTGCFSTNPEPQHPFPSQDINSAQLIYDSSFMTLDVSNPSEAILRLKDGSTIHFPTNYQEVLTGKVITIASKIEDTDGNIISISAPQDEVSDPTFAVNSITDTLNRTVTFSQSGMTYKDTNGATQTIMEPFLCPWTFRCPQRQQMADCLQAELAPGKAPR